jgi:hypothetical protein
MADPDESAVKKLKDLTSQLDKATAAGKAAVKEVVTARQKAAKATKLIQAARGKKARKRAGKKR